MTTKRLGEVVNWVAGDEGQAHIVGRTDSRSIGPPRRSVRPPGAARSSVLELALSRELPGTRGGCAPESLAFDPPFTQRFLHRRARARVISAASPQAHEQFADDPLVPSRS